MNYRENWQAYKARIIKLRSLGLWNREWGICLAAIMACMGLKLRGNAEREKKKEVVGGIKKNYHSVEKSSCSYIVW